jgi:hypothetical protein
VDLAASILEDCTPLEAILDMPIARAIGAMLCQDLNAAWIDVSISKPDQSAI